jgi:hypothetical protein
MGRIRYPYSLSNDATSEGESVTAESTPVSSIIWDVYELLVNSLPKARCTKVISLKKERWLRSFTAQEARHMIEKLNELSESTEIRQFVHNSAILKRCNLVQSTVTGLQISAVQNQPYWIWGWLLLLLQCYNVEYLSIPRNDAKLFIHLMSQIVVDTYHGKYASLGGNPYRIWSRLKEVCIKPLHSQDLIHAVGDSLPASQCVEMEDVMLLLLLPSLKKLYIWFMDSNSVTNFRVVSEKTEFAISSIEEIEVHMAKVPVDRLEAFFRPMRNLDRLIWCHRNRRDDRELTSEVFDLVKFTNALHHTRHALKSLTLSLPDSYPIRSTFFGFYSFKAFTTLIDLRIDASLLFSGHPKTGGPQNVPIALKDILPSSLEFLTVMRAWKNYKEFEWESLFSGFVYARRHGRFPRMERIRLCGDVVPHPSCYNLTWPAIGSIVERLQNTGIVIEALRNTGHSNYHRSLFRLNMWLRL